MRGEARTLAARDLMLGGRLLLGLRFFWSTLSSDCVFLMLLARKFMARGWEEPEVGRSVCACVCVCMHVW